ncbi:hypothetical protein OAB00_00160 [Akkermansiaceae bacterium]|nr:hypothetical protein [Akkermansiaceae bacterium]
MQTKEYAELWRISPHDLAKQNKSHFVTIRYTQEKLNNETINRAVSFEAKLVDGEPIIRK